MHPCEAICCEYELSKLEILINFDVQKIYYVIISVDNIAQPEEYFTKELILDEIKEINPAL